MLRKAGRAAGTAAGHLVRPEVTIAREQLEATIRRKFDEFINIFTNYGQTVASNSTQIAGDIKTLTNNINYAVGLVAFVVAGIALKRLANDNEVYSYPILNLTPSSYEPVFLNYLSYLFIASGSACGVALIGRVLFNCGRGNSSSTSSAGQNAPVTARQRRDKRA